MGDPQNNKIAGLQIARAFAALSIAYFHSRIALLSFPADSVHWIPLLEKYAWLGVDFFFAISGYVICMIVTKPDISRVDFMIRRVFRIYPLWIAASIGFLYFAFHTRGFQERDTWAFIAYSFTLLPTYNFPFYDLGWSLQHEIAFYVLSILIVPRFGLIGLAGFLAIGFAAGKLFDLPWYLAQFATYYGNFLAGILAFAIHTRFRKMSGLLLLAVGFGLLWFFVNYASRAWFSLALFVCLLGFVNLRIKPGSLTEKIGVTLGDASYSIYLLHPLVYWYTYSCLVSWWKKSPPWTAELFRFGALVAVCGLAIISYKKFEKPAIKLGEALIAKRKSRRQNGVVNGGFSSVETVRQAAD